MRFSDFVTEEMWYRAIIYSGQPEEDKELSKGYFYYDLNTKYVSDKEPAKAIPAKYISFTIGMDRLCATDVGIRSAIIAVYDYTSNKYIEFDISMPIGDIVNYDNIKDRGIDDFIVNKACLPLLKHYCIEGTEETGVHNDKVLLLGDFIPEDVYNCMQSEQETSLICVDGKFKDKVGTKEWFDNYINSDNFSYEPTTIRLENSIDTAYHCGTEQDGWTIGFVSSIATLSVLGVFLVIPKEDTTSYEKMKDIPITKYANSAVYQWVLTFSNQAIIFCDNITN